MRLALFFSTRHPFFLTRDSFFLTRDPFLLTRAFFLSCNFLCWLEPFFDPEICFCRLATNLFDSAAVARMVSFQLGSRRVQFLIGSVFWPATHFLTRNRVLLYANHFFNPRFFLALATFWLTRNLLLFQSAICLFFPAISSQFAINLFWLTLLSFNPGRMFGDSAWALACHLDARTPLARSCRSGSHVFIYIHFTFDSLNGNAPQFPLP